MRKMDIESIFQSIGEFGPYQKRVYFLVCLPIIFLGAGNMAFVFIAAIPDYRCFIPSCDTNSTHPVYDSPFLNFTIPVNNSTGKWDSCHRYMHLKDKGLCSPDDFSENNIEFCPGLKVFDKTVYKTTTVMEFNLTCHNEWEARMMQTIYFGGVLAGSSVFGFIADSIGRKLTIIIAIVGMATTGIITALITGIVSFNVLRFLNAVMSAGLFQTLFVLGLECVGARKRVMCGVIGEYFYALGEVVLGLVAWSLREWRMIQLVISAPVAGFIFYWWFIPESPWWYLANGKPHKAYGVLEKIAKGNKKTIPLGLIRTEDEEATNAESQEQPKERVTLFHVLRNPLLCARMISMFFIWISVTLVYYSLTTDASDLGGDEGPSKPYVNFILSALAEFPGYTLAWIGMACWGRRGSLATSLVLAGLSCSAAGFLNKYNPEFILIASLIGKCFITCAFAIIYVFTSEIFPTKVRGTVLGMCSTFARIGAMLAPFSSELSDIYIPLPMIVFGVLSLVAGALNIIMPETVESSLPNTIAEAENLGRSRATQPQVARVDEEVRPLLSDDCEEDLPAPDTVPKVEDSQEDGEPPIV